MYDKNIHHLQEFFKTMTKQYIYMDHYFKVIYEEHYEHMD